MNTCSGKIQPILLLLVLIPALGFLGGCSTPTIWGYSQPEFKKLVQSGALPQFSDPDISDLSLKELNRLGAGAAYFLSYHQFSDPDAPVLLRLHEIEGGEEPFASAAASALAADLLRRREYQQLLDISDSLGTQRPVSYEWQRAVMEAAYWSRKDRRALEMLDALERDFPDQTTGDQELRLIRAILLQRTGSGDWGSAVTSLFQDLPAGPLHVRAYDYLRLEGVLDSFSPPAQQLLRGVDLTARGAGGRAFPLLSELVASHEFIAEGSLASLAEAAAQGGRFRRAVELLQDLRTSGLTEDLDLKAAELQAWLLRRGGLHRDARTVYRELARSFAEKGSQGAAQAERYRWYAFSSLVKSDPSAAVGELPRLTGEMDDPEYYSDVLAELLERLCANRRWDRVREAYLYLDGAVNAAVLSPYAYISARSAEMNVLSERPGLPAQEIYRRIATGNYPGTGSYPTEKEPLWYYRILSSVRLGSSLEPDQPAPDSAEGEGQDAAGPRDILAAGFLEYGLPLEAARIAADSRVSAGRALATAQYLLAHEYTEEGLRLLLRRDLPGAPSALYPRPFLQQTEAAARKRDIPSWLFFALIREESLFNPAAVSYVGARGLTQLMPLTAADVAGRLRLEQPDLFDVETNLSIGAWYLKNMIDRTGSLSDALASYNAGINRLRRWRLSAGSLPGDLFLETVPFDETREYVKSLLVSSWFYGYLYYHTSAKAVTEEFFPDFSR